MWRPSRVCPGVTGMLVLHVLLTSSYELGFHTGYFEKGGGNHLMPPPTREKCTLWKNSLNRCIPFLLQQLPLCCCLCFKTTLV